jgi:predicted nucleic acid-binding protein
MILADTSVWIDYIRRPNLQFAQALRDEQILSHPFVIGELALGGVTSRTRIAQEIKKLFSAPVATADEVLLLIEGLPLVGSGIGYVDAHLIAATRLKPGTRLWTLDRKLHKVAEALGVAVQAKNPL